VALSIALNNADNSKNMVVANDGGEVSLYHNGSSKLATTSSGINVTGRIDADDFIVVAGSNPRLQVQDTDGTNQFSFLQQQGSDVFLRARNDTVDGRIVFAGYGGASTTNRLDINSGGDVRFWDETGASAKLVWDTSEEALEFGDNVKATFGASADLEVYHDGSASYIEEKGTGSLYIRGTQLRMQATDGTTYLEANDGGALTLKHNGATVFNTTSTGIDVTGTVAADGLAVSGTSNFVSVSTFGSIVVNGSTNYNHPTSGSATLDWEDDYLRYRFGGSATPQGIRIDNYDEIKIKLNRDGSAYFAGSVELNGWTITESGGSLYFATGGTNKMKLDASGNLDVVGSVNSNATIS